MRKRDGGPWKTKEARIKQHLWEGLGSKSAYGAPMLVQRGLCAIRTWLELTKGPFIGSGAVVEEGLDDPGAT